MFTEHQNYLSALTLDKAETTIRSYTAHLARFVEHFSINSLDALKAIDNANMRQYQKHLVETVATKSGKRNAPNSTVNTHFRALRAYFNWMVENGILETSPLNGIKMLKEAEKSTAVFLTVDERDAMLAECTNIGKKLMLAVMFFAGLRRQEVVKVMVKDVNTEKGTLDVHGKGGKLVEIPLHPYVLDLFHKYMKTRNNNSEYLFVTQKGFGHEQGYHPYSGQAIYDFVKSMARKAGVSDEKLAHIGAHSTRRSAACHLALDNVGTSTIQAFLRHAGVKTTERYIAPAMNVLRKAAVNSFKVPLDKM